MQLFTLGINHQTAPLAVREQVAFHAESLEQALHDLVGHRPVKEAAILSTCNRTEIYCNTDSPQQAIEWLADYHHIKKQAIEPHLYTLPQDEAVKHAFRVASGLDSMVLGETQILGQMKQAVHTAERRRHPGPAAAQAVPAHLLGRQGSAHPAPRSAPTAVSMAAAAVRLAERIFPSDQRTGVPVHRRRRDDRAVRHPFRRAAPASA